MSAAPEIQHEEIVLEKLRVAAQEYVWPGVMGDMLAAKVFVDEFTEAICARLEAYVLAEKLVDKTVEGWISVSTPATWWDHFKRDVLHRLPLIGKRIGWRMTDHERKWTASFEQFATFPASPIRIPESARGPKVVAYERLSSYSERGDS